MKKLLILTATLITMVFTTGTAHALQQALDKFNANYGTKVTECSLCHTSPPLLNSFGGNFFSSGGTTASGYAVNFGTLDGMDADGDGTLNGAQIAAGLSPADANITLASLSTGSTEKASVTGCLSGISTPIMMLGFLFVISLMLKRRV